MSSADSPQVRGGLTPRAVESQSMLIRNRMKLHISAAVCVAVVFACASPALSAVKPDLIVLLPRGDLLDEYVVTGETWLNVSTMRIIDGKVATLPQSSVLRVNYGDIPDAYDLAMVNRKRSRWRTASANLEQVLKEYDAGEDRPWIKQYALYHLAECRRILAEPAGDTAALQDASDVYARLLREVPDTKFKHDAMLAVARCAMKIAEITKDRDERAAAAGKARAAYAALAEAAAGDFEAEEHAKARELWLRRARLGETSVNCLTAENADAMKKAAGQLRALAAEARRVDEVALGALIRASWCELAATRMEGGDDAESVKDAGELIKRILASDISDAARDRLVVAAYFVMGGHYYERALATARDDPAREERLDEAALSYLRIVILYPATAGAEAENLNALCRTALMMKERGEFRLARELLEIMGRRYAESDLWQKLGSKMLSEMPG